MSWLRRLTRRRPPVLHLGDLVQVGRPAGGPPLQVHQLMLLHSPDGLRATVELREAGGRG